ncbi:uncharacterized protein LOC126554455 [Aphis gossypii]|uniref:uncharacterized protein LOC126554455 n=1 Tax=Aphis gossypii TaxID=80765 RepID=UPI0021591CB0|nr:uncharacterized protein LOC126554455 [Aphis gossypii]
MRQRAVLTMEHTSCVINECVNGLSDAAKGVLQSSEALKRQVWRIRNNKIAASCDPSDLLSLQIPDEYKNYSPSIGINENFLLADSGPSNERILIFGRPLGLKLLKDSKIWYMDGTFKVAPTLFSQVYVILTEFLEGVHPAVYALLPNKKEQTYIQLISMINQLQPDLQPTSVSCDFELGAITAIKNSFENINSFGCYFYLSQNFLKKVGELHLLSKYNNEANFCVATKTIIALTFIPLCDLDMAADELADELPDELLPLFEWFEEFYIGKKNRRIGRRKPRYSPVMWNLHQRISYDTDRTNNHAEAANRRLNIQMGTHSTIWTFIANLKKIQAGRDTYYANLVSGNSPPRKLKKFQDTDKIIKRLVNNYDGQNKMIFLRGIANNIALK